MAEALCLGELLIDFVPTVTPTTLIDAPAFRKAPGGAPANVAVGLARLGIDAGFLGKVGDEPFGHFLADTLAADRVDITGLRYSQEARTALAFVSLRADGDREFMFYRHPSADMLYTPEEVDLDAIHAARLLHFGSITLISEPSRSATLHAVRSAREAGLLISYDPNLRSSLWPGEDAARAGIMLAWTEATVTKVSEEELTFLSGKHELLPAARALWHDRLRLLLVTRGHDGCVWVTRDATGTVPGFRVTAIDTTGAGDGFTAGLLRGLLEQPDAVDDPARLDQICRFANAVGALATTERGAIPALPSLERTKAFLAAQPA